MSIGCRREVVLCFFGVEDFFAIPLTQVIGYERLATDQNDGLDAAKLVEYAITNVVGDPPGITFTVFVKHGFEIDLKTGG